MSITCLENFPVPETEPSSDWSVYSHFQAERQMNYLIYAVKRDFLSTPKTYAVIRFYDDDNSPFNFRQFHSTDYFDWLKLELPNKNGIYQIISQEEKWLALLMDNTLIEIEYNFSADYGQTQFLYHKSSSSDALLELLQTPSLFDESESCE